ncbi:hypothetical protein BC939DRAFT_9926 [Gamsiella multidivaricata]|uniref:uncharacterized protein n=1 Tax=Gamsiella multidivaricata TaxID=101098 RepID=UPI00221EF429|nr:uncharacterized protein BC939DRAFT_9926 [Gamsiella multidivaricata]KAI7829509.1 hypothetical protein BC939DRAFT_9926 [Gamsiella multidivaricata]
MDKALMDGLYDLSRLDQKEKVSLLMFLGQPIDGNDPFDSLLQAARIYRNTNEQELDTISSPSGTRFPVVDTEGLYVRHAYKDLCDKVASTFTDSPDTTYQNRIVVAGTPGIGKSAFLLYFTIRLLAASNDDNPPLVVFHTQEGSDCYVYGGISTVRQGKIDDFRLLLDLPETWYLIDSSPNPALVQAKTIISASPQILCPDSGRYQDVLKETPQLHYMAPWEFDELETCRVCVRSFNVVGQDLMKRLYFKIGGVPRYVLHSPANTLGRDRNDFAGAESKALYRVQLALNNAKGPLTLLQYLAQKGESLEFSSHLLHRWPTNDHADYHLRWATNYIKMELVEGLGDESWIVLLKAMQMGLM